MKNKLERKLDMDFAQLKLTPRVYHFIHEYSLFTAITIVDTHKTRRDIKTILDFLEYNMDADANDLFFPASRSSTTFLRANSIHGFALCSLQDQFNRQRGRIIAKGRLLKHLKQVRKRKMKKEDEIVDEIVEDVLDVIWRHQYDLSDGFEFYAGVEDWKAIRSEIKEIIEKRGDR